MTGESVLFYDLCIDKDKTAQRREKPGFRAKYTKKRIRCQYIGAYTKGGRAMAKELKEIMVALDKVLTTTVWVNADRQIISLADELHIGRNNAPRSIEDLSRAALTGAYISLQIRIDNFDVAAETLETHELALRVKDMVFAEAKKILDAEAGAPTDKIAMAA